MRFPSSLSMPVAMPWSALAALATMGLVAVQAARAAQAAPVGQAAARLGVAETVAGGPSRSSLGHDGLPGVHGAFSSRSLHPGEFVLGLAGAGHAQPDILTWKADGQSGTSSPSEGLFVASHSFLAIGLGYGLDGALGLPYYYEYFSGDGHPAYEGQGIGDLLLSMKGTIPGSTPRLAFSILISGSVPIASGEGRLPRELLYQPPDGKFPSASSWPFGTMDPRVGLGLGATLSLPGWTEPLLLHFNLQGERPLTTGDEDVLGVVRGNLALELPLAGWAEAQASLLRELLVADVGDRSRDVGQAMQLSVGLALRPAPWLTMSVAGRFAPDPVNLPIGLRQDGQAWKYRPHAPAELFLGAFLQGFPLRWDRDGDGFTDSRDRCPHRAEDKDGYEDSDGCPDIDNDRDGFVDTVDQCPMAGEDRDGFKDWDGCPDEDNDADGVIDSRDACGNDAEDKDGHEDEDGCPDLDDDRDGVPDAADRCPRAAETRNRFEDSDGCPEADSDGDGMPDKIDRCPLEDEIVNFFEDTDGCPDEKPAPVQNGILPGVAFLTGNVELLPQSFSPLDSLARLMSLYPGTDIEIQVHVDDHAGSGAVALSQDRARAVARYLVGKGVEHRRLKPVGFGSSRPLDNNRTAKGRQINRRVEIRRLN